MTVGLAATAEVCHTELKRKNEAQRLFVGDQFCNVIVMFRLQGPEAGVWNPAMLQDLLKDPRDPHTKRYLRKIYADPMTNSTKWGLLKGGTGTFWASAAYVTIRPPKRKTSGLQTRRSKERPRIRSGCLPSPSNSFRPSRPVPLRRTKADNS
jgi:hypothetical protein